MSDEDHPTILPEERSWFEQPGTLRLIWRIVLGACAFFAVMNIGLAIAGKTHPHFAWWSDGNPVFYGIVGFLSFSFIILAGQHLRKILMRPEGYYDGAEAELPRRDGGEGSQ